jgi:uncharacterized protein (DUF488 family)
MSVVYTIGYKSTDIDRFVTTLKTAGIERAADVRAVTLSRKKGFSKKALAARLEAEEIQYLHFIELDDPRPGREAARSSVRRSGAKTKATYCWDRRKSCNRSLSKNSKQIFRDVL